MPAHLQERNVEGTLVVEVAYTTPAIPVLEALGRMLDEVKPVVRLYPQPVCRCGNDARHEATMDDGKIVYLCPTCVETTYDWRYARAL